MITSDEIKSLAESFGFDACGITRAEPVPEAEKRLKSWLEEGSHGTMKYLENFEARAKKFWESFPEAKSIIVVGVNYYSNHPVIASTAKRGEAIPSIIFLSKDRDSPRGAISSKIASASLESPPRNDAHPVGRVARYAWGKDYHGVIRKRLEEFREKLCEMAGREIRAEICVDTKPLLERSIAQKAGLGFIGKQSQLLNPKFGPWLFLAELVTDLELEPDTPFIGSCGTCRICIDECPTQAIRPEGGIDARRCIAYLTIEHKGEIAENLRPLVGDWVFGCDICLEVCPYSSKAKETQWPELAAESGQGPFLDLLKLFQIPSNRTYKREFEGRAILRANRKQLRRNAEIVLQNGGFPC